MYPSCPWLFANVADVKFEASPAAAPAAEKAAISEAVAFEVIPVQPTYMLSYRQSCDTHGPPAIMQKSSAGNEDATHGLPECSFCVPVYLFQNSLDHTQVEIMNCDMSQKGVKSTESCAQ